MWHGERYRHRMARKGVRTSYKSKGVETETPDYILDINLMGTVLKVPYFVQNKRPILKSNEKLIDSKIIIHKSGKKINVYRVNVIENIDGRYVNTEKSEDISGSFERVDTKFKLLSDNEISKNKWLSKNIQKIYENTK